MHGWRWLGRHRRHFFQCHPDIHERLTPLPCDYRWRVHQSSFKDSRGLVVVVTVTTTSNQYFAGNRLRRGRDWFVWENAYHKIGRRRHLPALEALPGGKPAFWFERCNFLWTIPYLLHFWVLGTWSIFFVIWKTSNRHEPHWTGSSKLSDPNFAWVSKRVTVNLTQFLLHPLEILSRVSVSLDPDGWMMCVCLKREILILSEWFQTPLNLRLTRDTFWMCCILHVTFNLNIPWYHRMVVMLSECKVMSVVCLD